MIEAGEALLVRGRVLGEPAEFSEIDLASDAADLGCQWRDNGLGAKVPPIGRKMRSNLCKSEVELEISTKLGLGFGMMIPRLMSETLLAAAKEYPVVTLTGPRQAGKTTLVRAVFPDYGYCNLEKPRTAAFGK